MLRKIEKAKRYWRWRWKAANNAPLFWHVGRPNFGDDINPSFMQRLCDHPIRFAIDRSKPHLLGTGSILEKATGSSIIAGSGYLKESSGPLPKGARMISVRGQRTLERTETDQHVLLGDPLIMIDTLFESRIEKRYRLGLVPHFSNLEQMKALYGQHVHIISPADEPWKVVDQIAACERIVSQSLHGLIVADSFEVPNLWLAPSASMIGGRFKFDDYFTTLDQPKPMIDESLNVFQNPAEYPFSVCRYKYCKSAYRAALHETLVEFDTTLQNANGEVAA